jgi:hypothetical protein
MSFRPALLSLAALAALTAPAPAGEFDKFLPDDTQLYVHVRMPKFFESGMVRKAVPMAFDKYGAELAGLAGMAKQMNPQMPDVPEDAFKRLSDPKEIAQFFDMAKNVISDVVVAGSGGGMAMQPVMLIKCEMITNDMMQMVSGMVANAPQMKLETMKKPKGTVWELTLPQGDQKIYLSVPTQGLLQISMSDKVAEASFEAKGKAGDKLKALLEKQDKTDFVFVASTGGDASDYQSMAANVTLDDNLTGKVNATFKDAETAAAKAKEITEQFANMFEQLKGQLGDKADLLKPYLDKAKATADGKTVSANFTMPGTAVETMLKK